MVQVNELRTGNFVKCKTSNDAGIYIVTAIDGLHLKVYLTEPRKKWHTENLIKPIPLNEDWLLKFGFIKRYSDCFEHGKMILNNKFVMMDIDITVTLKYVHQLQNLYFVLLRKELTLKPESNV